MLLQALREEVLEANLELVRHGLVLYTFGNVSGIARKDQRIAIKPSGVPYESMKPEHIVITDLNGAVMDGDFRPSSDLPTHVELYSHFASIGGVAHTHSEFATAWAQARRPIPCFGTTHADYFHGPVPTTEELTAEEIGKEYERNTGVAICRAIDSAQAERVPAILVSGHAPFCWGPTASMAAHNAVILEYVARMAYHTLALSPQASAISTHLHDKHFLRKHGPSAYYGQTSTK